MEKGAGIALGGPVYLADHVGPLTNPAHFQTALLQELQDLQAELSTNGVLDEVISVEELKVFTEEELVEKALEALKESENGSISRTVQVENTLEMVCSSVSAESLNDVSIPCEEAQSKEKSRKKLKGRKRGKNFDRDARAKELEDVNFNCVEHFARIKEIQDADKSAARLHSFCGSSKPMATPATSTADSLWKLHSLRSTKSFPKVRSSRNDQHDPVAQPEVLLCVEVYDCRLSWQKAQEIFVLGSQKLTALRDNIYCSMDHLMQKSGQSEPSGYFLIEGLFLNDLRDPHAVDYSKPILEWLVNSRNEAKEKWEFIVASEMKRRKKLLEDLSISDLPLFTAMDMDKMYFRDLHFRLGSGYLYCHQGNCRHLIVIRDMRLLHPDDDQNKLSYPLLTFTVRKKQQKCSVCKIKPSAMATVDDRWAGQNPCFFCKDCYYLLHYKEDGSLLYENFSVFDLEGVWPNPLNAAPS